VAFRRSPRYRDVPILRGTVRGSSNLLRRPREAGALSRQRTTKVKRPVAMISFRLVAIRRYLIGGRRPGFRARDRGRMTIRRERPLLSRHVCSTEPARFLRERAIRGERTLLRRDAFAAHARDLTPFFDRHRCEAAFRDGHVAFLHCLAVRQKRTFPGVSRIKRKSIAIMYPDACSQAGSRSRQRPAQWGGREFHRLKRLDIITMETAAAFICPSLETNGQRHHDKT
jgi:hypothetical protein